MTEKQPPSYPLRMPQELRDQLTDAAKASGRSVNAEIVARLQDSFARQPQMAVHTAHRRISDLDASSSALTSIPFAQDAARQWLEEHQRKEREEMKKMIAAAIGPTVQDAMKEFEEQQRKEREKWIEQITHAALPLARTLKKTAK